MMDVVYYVAASLDGYIAKVDGDVAWLDELGIKPDESGYEAFFAEIDGLLMGRATYDQVVSFGSWPYGDLPTWVCTRRALKAMDGCVLKAEREPETAVVAAQQMGLKRLWFVGGGNLAAALMQKGLMTEVSLAQMPIILGQGIPLFGHHARVSNLTLQSVERFGVFTQLTYHVDKG